MKVTKLFAVIAVVGLGALTSCEKTSTAEQDELNELSIDKDEIKEEDVM